MISVLEAEQLILETLTPGPSVTRPLEEASGEILREDLVADRPFPPYDRVAMDGVALDSSSWQGGARAFRIASTQRAGEAPHSLANLASCIEVMTGAVLPLGCDAVVPVEQLQIRDGTATLAEGATVKPMQNVHRCAMDRRPGDVLLKAGTLLTGPQCAVAATVGCASLDVTERPAVAVIGTGDELVPVDAMPLPHQVRRSNGPAMCAALAAAGFNRVTCDYVPDEREAMVASLGARLAEARVLVLSGGVSAGRFDFVPDVLKELGVRAVFHQVAQRPGKPLWFGVDADGRAVFGVPGNPVSALVCLHRFVLPALWRLLGATLLPVHARPHAVLGESVRFAKPLTVFQPVALRAGAEGGIVAVPVPMNGSGDLAGLALSEGVLELPSEGDTYEAGTAFPLWSWRNPHAMLSPLP